MKHTPEEIKNRLSNIGEAIGAIALDYITDLEKENTKLQRACHKWFMRWREAKKDALYFDSSLQKQIEATLKLQQENAELKEELKDANIKVVHLACNQNKDLKKENAELKRIVKMVAMINKGIYTPEGIKAIYAEAEQLLKEE